MKKEETSVAEFTPSLQQVIAAIIDCHGAVEISLESLLKNYEGKVLGIEPDEETETLKIFLSDLENIIQLEEKPE